MDKNPTTCLVCKTQGHNETQCPQLSDPLQNGFYTGGGGGGGHSHEEDDD
jgi:hypothetical protein